MRTGVAPSIAREMVAAETPERLRSHIVAARSCTRGRVVVAFQPYGYQTVRDHADGWREALAEADFVYLTDIDPGHESRLAGITAGRLGEGLTVPMRHVPAWPLLADILAQDLAGEDLLIVAGQGSIRGLVDLIESACERRARLPRIAVIYGGASPEREVSLFSGEQVQAALERRGYESFLVDVVEEVFLRGDLSSFVGPDRPDLAFLAVHGKPGEDGALQGFFETLGIPYTGPGVQASAIGIDKAMTKRLLGSAGLPVPQGESVTRDSPQCSLAPPLVVKPNSQGSTVGLTFVEDKSALQAALEHGFRYDETLLLEEWLHGVEISVPVLGNRALPVVEIVPATGRYDYASKYLPGATEEIVPARLDATLTERVQQLALQAHEVLGCVGATRTDMIVTEQGPVILEVNTLPGLTMTSLLPNSARAAGIEFDDLVEWVAREALTRHARA